MTSVNIFQMNNRMDYEDKENLTSYLANQLNRGRLTLLLGAGISTAFGLPDWKTLLEKMFSIKGDALRNGEGLEQEAERFRITYYADNYNDFISSIKESLYDSINTDFKELRKNDTLGAIGALVMSSRRGSASEIMTFNWDNLLEKYLEYHGFVTRSIYNEKFWIGSADVTILHPHGFIPFESSERHSEEIVFDQSSYSKVIGKDSNLWRQKAITLLRTNTCLFIGLSGKDLNLDALLQTCKDSHASLNNNSLFWGITFTTSTEEYIKRKWEDRGIYCLEITDYKIDLPDFLFKVCQKASKLH